MPPRLEEKVRKLFSMIDVDDSKTIDREETLKFWSKGFAKINSSVLFEQVDKNNRGIKKYLQKVFSHKGLNLNEDEAVKLFNSYCE